MTLDLTEDEARALAKHLRQGLDYDPFPLAPQPDPLKAILAMRLGKNGSGAGATLCVLRGLASRGTSR